MELPGFYTRSHPSHLSDKTEGEKDSYKFHQNQKELGSLSPVHCLRGLWCEGPKRKFLRSS